MKSVIGKYLSPTVCVFVLTVAGSYAAAAQSKNPLPKKCVEFSDLQAGSLTANFQADAKLQVRKYLWTNWEVDKARCADLVLHTPNGLTFKWTYTISMDKTHKKQLTVQFFDKGSLESTQIAFTVRRWHHIPNY